MISNKGISPAIAWVLLVGLTVTLAITVFNWSKEQAEEFGESVTSKAERDMRCENVAFNAICENGDISVINKGDFSIHKFLIREYSASGLLGNREKVLNNPLKPGRRTPEYLYTMSQQAQEVDLVPVIKIEDELVPCTNRKIVTSCN